MFCKNNNKKQTKNKKCSDKFERQADGHNILLPPILLFFFFFFFHQCFLLNLASVNSNVFRLTKNRKRRCRDLFQCLIMIVKFYSCLYLMLLYYLIGEEAGGGGWGGGGVQCNLSNRNLRKSIDCISVPTSYPFCCCCYCLLVSFC